MSRNGASGGVSAGQLADVAADLEARFAAGHADVVQEPATAGQGDGYGVHVAQLGHVRFVRLQVRSEGCTTDGCPCQFKPATLSLMLDEHCCSELMDALAAGQQDLIAHQRKAEHDTDTAMARVLDGFGQAKGGRP